MRWLVIKLPLLLVLASMSSWMALAQTDESNTKILRDIEYASVEGTDLLLDLYIPAKAEGAPLLVWVHGGAWRRGSRSRVPVQKMVEDGWAIASVDYRLTPVARFPAQVHDIKAAIRFLRAKAGNYGYNANKLVISGASAGAHLANLVGVTNKHKSLEGSVGAHLGESSDVQAIVSFYGAGNLTSILTQSTPHGLGVRIPALQLLFGGQPEDKPEIARLASPVFHVDRSDPPLLLLHGDQDPQMPISQSHELQGRYQELGLQSKFDVVYGSAHGGAAFYDEAHMSVVREFLKTHLK